MSRPGTPWGAPAGVFRKPEAFSWFPAAGQRLPWGPDACLRSRPLPVAGCDSGGHPQGWPGSGQPSTVPCSSPWGALALEGGIWHHGQRSRRQLAPTRLGNNLELSRHQKEWVGVAALPRPHLVARPGTFLGSFRRRLSVWVRGTNGQLDPDTGPDSAPSLPLPFPLV